MRRIQAGLLAISTMVLGFGGGLVVRGCFAKSAAECDAALSSPMSAFSLASRDRLALVMIEKNRVSEYEASSEGRLAEDLADARKVLENAPHLLKSPLRRYPWLASVLPNVVGEFRRSAEYLGRRGKYPRAAADGQWVVERLEAALRGR